MGHLSPHAKTHVLVGLPNGAWQDARGSREGVGRRGRYSRDGPRAVRSIRYGARDTGKGQEQRTGARHRSTGQAFEVAKDVGVGDISKGKEGDATEEEVDGSARGGGEVEDAEEGVGLLDGRLDREDHADSGTAAGEGGRGWERRAKGDGTRGHEKDGRTRRAMRKRGSKTGTNGDATEAEWGGHQAGGRAGGQKKPESA